MPRGARSSLSSSCGVYVDPFKTQDYGTAGQPSYQLSVAIPDAWVAGTAVTVDLKPGATELERCWNIEGGASLTLSSCVVPPGMSSDACSLRATGGTDADPTTLSFKLIAAAPGFAPGEVGCIVRGQYTGYIKTTYDGVACSANPPPPPVQYTRCRGVSFEMYAEKQWADHTDTSRINWQAQVRVADWKEGREVKLSFPGDSVLVIKDVQHGHHSTGSNP